MSGKKYQKSKIIICLSYLFMALLYISFIYINFAQGTYGDGMQIFGCNMYIIDSNQTVFVDYSKLPKQGDMVLYEVDGEKKIASVNSISQSNILFLSVDDNGETKYYNEPMVYGVITSIIPGLSYIYLFLTSFWGIFLIIILPCGFILTFQFITLIKMFSKNKLKTKNGFNFETSVPLRQRRKRGVEIKIHPPAVSEITLKLKNDGSLIIDTNTYTANIDMEIE